MEKLELFRELFEVCILPIAGAVGIYIANYFNNKTKNLKAQKKDSEIQNALLLLNNTVENAVLFTKQTFVDNHKKNGTFDAATQKVAYELTYAVAMATITEETKKTLAGVINDLPKYINSLIEAKVHMTK